MNNLLPLLWFRSGAPMTICCRCFNREVVPQKRFVTVALASKWCANAKMFDLLPLLWSRSGASLLRCSICCRCFGLEVLPHFQDVRFVAVAEGKWCPISKMYKLLPFMLRCTIWMPLLWSFENGGIVETKATVTNRTS